MSAELIFSSGPRGRGLHPPLPPGPSLGCWRFVQTPPSAYGPVIVVVMGGGEIRWTHHKTLYSQNSHKSQMFIKSIVDYTTNQAKHHTPLNLRNMHLWVQRPSDNKSTVHPILSSLSELDATSDSTSIRMPYTDCSPTLTTP